MPLIVLLSGLSISLGGCATGSVSDPVGPVSAATIQVREQRLEQLDAFRVSGGFGYWDERQNLSASIDWERAGASLAIELRAPLGLGRLVVTEDGEGARLQRSGQAPLEGASAAQVLSTALGLPGPVPLDEIGHWIRGLPGPDATQVQRDEFGRLSRLIYRDTAGQRWRATVRRYRRVDEFWLPVLLTAVSGERHLRLALSDWDLRSEATPLSPAERPSSPARPSRRLPLPGA